MICPSTKPNKYVTSIPPLQLQRTRDLIYPHHPKKHVPRFAPFQPPSTTKTNMKFDFPLATLQTRDFICPILFQYVHDCFAGIPTQTYTCPIQLALHTLWTYVLGPFTKVCIRILIFKNERKYNIYMPYRKNKHAGVW